MAEKKKDKSALYVRKGVKPSSAGDDAVKRFQKAKRPKVPVSEYVKGILAGDMGMLSQAITLVESSLPEHKEDAVKIVEQCLEHSGNSIRIGITGVPGAGKSTFIESLGSYLTKQGRKLAVLAIDASSHKTGGSILGDKTRMENLAADPNAYIRPSPSAGSLGGVARKTRETIILCEAAGYDTVFVETVGVGQSEIAAHSMVDFFLLLMIAGAGDELQGIKRGIMEMADALIINKADGTNMRRAERAKSIYENTLNLFPPKESGWTPKILTCSAIKGYGIERVWNNIMEYKDNTTENNYFADNRSSQAIYWMYETINEDLRNNFYKDPAICEKLSSLEQKVKEGKISPFKAAGELLDQYIK